MAARPPNNGNTGGHDEHPERVPDPEQQIDREQIARNTGDRHHDDDNESNVGRGREHEGHDKRRNQPGDGKFVSN